MTLISSPVPQVGVAVATEESDATNLLTEIKAVLNGLVGSENLSAAFAAVVNPPVVSGLPGTPVDGTRVRFRMAVGVMAALRYNSSRPGPFKWEADGDSAWTVGPQVGVGLIGGAGSAYQPFTGPGNNNVARIVVPLSGVYRLSAGGATGGDTILSVATNSATTDAWVVSSGGSVGSRTFPDLSLTAGDSLAFAHRSSSGGGCSSQNYWLSLVPLVVG